jgi:L-cystine transport system substrate-binding protein
MKRERKAAAGIIAAMFMVVAAGNGFADSGKKSRKTETIIVGTGNAYKPYCYLDDDGNLQGYEKDVLDAVNKLLPQYKFVYDTYTFKDILIALATGKIDIGAHQYELNPERQKNYLFASESYSSYVKYIEVLDSNNTIHGIDDLTGKKVSVMTGSNSAYVLEQYNKSHPDKKIIIVYTGSLSNEEVVAGMQNGIWDARTDIKRETEKYNKEYNAGFKLVGKPIASSYAYFVFAKGNTKLADAVSGALKQLKLTGELAKISVHDLGGDYTQKE